MSDFLPEELEQITVSGLQEGETSYTVPWAIFVEESGLSWIRGDYSVFPSPKGDATLRIRRQGREIFAAKETVGDYRYEIRDKPMEEWKPLPLKWE